MPKNVPVLADTVLEAMEGREGEVSVKQLAEELGENEYTVRTALNYHVREKRMQRRQAPADGPTKPPFLFSLTAKHIEEATNDMPTIRQAVEAQDEGEDPVYPAPEQAEPGGVEQEEQGLPPGSFLRPDPVAEIPPSARGVQNVRMRQELRAADEEVDRRTGHVAGGSFRVKRVEPIPPQFPVIELGVIGKVVELNLVGSLEDYIRDTFGGGAFEVWPCDGAGNILKGMRPIFVEIAGVPKPMTEEGRTWLERYKKRLENELEADGGKRRGEPTVMELMERSDQRAREAQQTTIAMMQSVFQATRPADSSQAVETLRVQHASELTNLRNAHAAELSNVRADAERRVKDAVAAVEKQSEAYKGQAETLKEQLAEVKDDLRSLEMRKDQERANALAERDRAHSEKVTDLKEQHNREVTALKESHAKELQSVKEKARDDVERARADAARDVENAKVIEGLKREAEKAKEKPQDIQSRIQAGMIPELVRISVQQAKKSIGFEEERDDTWMGTLKETFRDAAPNLIEKVVDVATAALAQRQGINPAAIPQRPTRPPARPAQPALPAPVAAPPTALVPAPAAPEANQPAAAPALSGPPPVTGAVEARIVAFLTVTSSELVIDSDPVEAWVVPVADAGGTLADLWPLLPGRLRRSVEAVKPEQAWESFRDVLKPSPEDPLVKTIEEQFATAEGKEWLRKFFEAGPWTWEEEGEEEEEQEGKTSGE